MTDYKYQGLPITPLVIESLIVELANGQTLKRSRLVKIVLDYHISNGGLASGAKDFSRSVKKALERLAKNGNATSALKSFWTIQKLDSPIQESNIVVEINESKSAHTIYGDGEFSVYCYYYPAYKLLAQLQGKSRWPCKIGRSDLDPMVRVMSQSTTSLPEFPTVEFVIKSSYSNKLETAIHGALHMRGHHLESSPGSEWFDTNPSEVLDIANFLQGNSCDSSSE